MFTQWATRRLCKFLLKKRLGRYIRGDLDLEQLEIQLGSGVVQLNDVALDIDYVNEQLADLPVVLKEGSLGSVTLKLQWNVLPAIEIEVDEVELVLAPREAAENLSSRPNSAVFDGGDAQHTGFESEFNGLASSGGCTYLPVQEGVRVVANLVESLLLGMHVKIRHAIVAFEELPGFSKRTVMGKGTGEISHSMLVIRVGYAEYGVNSFSGHEGNHSREDSIAAESVVLTKAVTFQDMTLEVLDVLRDGSKCNDRKASSEKTSGGKSFGQPVSILLGDEGLSGCVKLSIPWTSGCLNIPKLNADINISLVKLRVSAYEIQRLLNVASSFGNSGSYNMANGGTNQLNVLNNNGLLIVNAADDKKEWPGSAACLPSELGALGSQSKPPSSPLLPVTRLISDWVHWNGGSNDGKEEVHMSEADFAASTDEFFECFDGTRSSQASLSGSGLWTWTCSAFSAITAASSLASGSVLISQDSANQVEYDFKVRILGISAILFVEETPITNVNVTWDGYLEACFSDIDVSVQVSQRHSVWQLVVSQIEVSEDQRGPMRDVGFSYKPGSDRIIEKISSSTQSLQSLVENALPGFSVSLNADEACQRQGCQRDVWSKQTEGFPIEGSKAERNGASGDYWKKRFLRLSSLGHLPGGRIIVKQDFIASSVDNKDTRKRGHTSVEIHLQPLIVWLDASIVDKIQTLVDIFTVSSGDSKTRACFEKARLDCDSSIGRSSGACASSKNILDIDFFIPSLRIFACLPHAPGSRLWKDSLLCLDVFTSATKLQRPLLAAKLYNTSHNGNPSSVDSITVAFKDGSLYLISPDNSTKQRCPFVALSFMSQKVLSVSEFNHRPVSLEVRLRAKSTGIWLAEQAWSGVMEKQRGGMGGSDNGRMNSEFAAATATEVVDENNCRIREDIVSSSSFCLHAIVPCIKLELFASQHAVVLALISSFVDMFSHEHGQPAPQSTKHSLGYESSNSPLSEDNAQASVVIDVTEVEIVFHPEKMAKENLTGERKGNNPWGCLRIAVRNFQVLYVLNLGMIKGASYLWLWHESGHVGGLLDDGDLRELPLLTCRNDALGRGDGGGGNALATSSAGVELTIIIWPDGHHLEDMLITATIRGGTFIAHGGRLDWLPTLITFFGQPVDKVPLEQAISEKGCSPTAEISLVRLEVATCKTTNAPCDNCTFFSLDLHDVALCYEPGEEAVLAGNIRARGMADAQGDPMESFAPVACILAAAAVRVSSNAISSTPSKEYGIWLRDVALLLVDTTLGRHSIPDYTPDALHQAGYAKVAGEAVMEAVVRINGEEGLQWEVECANNQLRLDTCHDTTAALGRLVAQFQQLFAPDIEHSTIPAQDRKNIQDIEASSAGEISTVMQEDSDNDTMLLSDLVHGDRRIDFEGMLEDAFTFVRDSSSNLNMSVNTSSFPCDNVESETRRGELLGRFEMLGRSDLSSDDAAEAILYSNHGSPDGQTKDFWTPLSQKDGLPSFIEDYYFTKNASLHSSRSSSLNDSGEFLQHVQGVADEIHVANFIEGTGGWYEGQTFSVVENHVPEVKSRLGCKKQRGSLSHSSNKRLALATKYPVSLGRVVLQDLNLRWRLYGGSDWPVAKACDARGPSHTQQGRAGRQLGVCLEVMLYGVELQYDTFPESELYASRLAVSIRDVRVYDCSKDAPWKKVLGYHRLKSRPRESSAKALKLELESVRPDPLVPLEEYRLSVHLLPILLHLDQRHLDFIVNFFPSPGQSSSSELYSGYEEICDLNASGLRESKLGTKAADTREEALLPFFQTCELQPFTIRVDYVPRRIDIAALRGGNYAELFNLVSWKGIELELKYVHAAEVHGWGALSGIVVGEWLEDISHNQIHKLIRGLGPIRPLFAVGSGAAKLIVLPAEHYRKDRRQLLRGMRKGAIAFLRSISLEAVGLGVQLAAGAHEILRHTESALGAVALSSSLASEKIEIPTKVSQPGDTREGLQQACESLTRGLEKTASSLIGNPLKVYQRGAGTSVAVASALRAAPAAALAPASAAAGAVHRALLGVRNSLDPEHRRESEEKHSGPPPE